jgi:competence protein ComEC
MDSLGTPWHGLCETGVGETLRQPMPSPPETPPRRSDPRHAPSARRPDSALVVGLALTLGGIAPVAPWEVCVGAVVLLALLRAAGRVTLVVAAAVLVAGTVGGVRAVAAVARHERTAALADAAMPAPARCSAHARVSSSPVEARDTLRYDADLDSLLCDGSPVAWTGAATLYGGPADLARGDEVEVVASLAPPQRLWNPSGGDPRPSEARRGVFRSGGAIDVRWALRARGFDAWIDRVRAHLRRRIDSTFAPELAPMARALVLGESDLSPDDDQSFRVSGLSHLLAVSGMHLVLVLGLLTRTLAALLTRVRCVAARWEAGRIVSALGLPAAWVYAELAGFGGSTVRAAWMASVVLGARCLGRRASPSRAFGLSLLAMAGLDPLVGFDLSFLLSAAATGGLLAFARPLGDRLSARAPARLEPVVRATATTLAASIPCTPILARFSATFPLGGVPANLLAVPVGECVALPVCLVQALLWWWPAAERGSARVASGALVLVRLVARTFSLPALTADVPQPTAWQLCVAAVAFASPWAAPGSRRVLGFVAAVTMILLEALARRAGAPTGVLRATFLDVGQGDSAIVDLPDGSAIVIDGGGLVGSPIDVGLRVLAPELRRRRRGSVVAAVLTHPHPDHFGGLVTGLEAVRVGELWDTGQGEVEATGGSYQAIVDRARARAVPVRRPDSLCGPHTIGGARFEVLAPCPTFSSDRGPNDNSLVMRITFGTRAILFVGDAEHEEEALLLASSPGALRADVLKVGHHGSRTSSTPGFVAAVAPSEAVVSAGRRNRFGHPSPVTLATLERAGCRVWRTDRDGAVTVTTDGRSLDVRAVAAW